MALLVEQEEFRSSGVQEFRSSGVQEFKRPIGSKGYNPSLKSLSVAQERGGVRIPISRAF
jgi:hypothetical protein